MVITAVLPIGGGKFSQYVVLDESVCSWDIVSMIKKSTWRKTCPIATPSTNPHLDSSGTVFVFER